MEPRIEKDSLGNMRIANDKLWGAVTQRSLENFNIGDHPMPHEIIIAIALIKKNAAKVNFEKKIIEKKKAGLIIQASQQIIDGELFEHFPLSIWQTGSGTHTNMNINEVIANKAHCLNGGKLTDKDKTIHPNDHVNMSQSSNDVFPSAIHIALVKLLHQECFPALKKLKEGFNIKAKEFHNIIKTGRTHLMDAVPLRLGDEFSAYSEQIKWGIHNIQKNLEHLSELAIGGTAVGTGLNCPEGFSERICTLISEETKIRFIPASNKFESMSSKSAILSVQNTLSQIATDLFKIANDIRLMSSGPRTGINELILPAKEPGSSIMPGKVNPTQIEAMQMSCIKIISNASGTALANMNGHFQLNTFMPLIAFQCIESTKLLSDICLSFLKNNLLELKANTEKIQTNLNQSLMLITALNSHIGYEKSAKIAQLAQKQNISLREAALSLKYISGKDYDNIINPNKMV